MQRRQVSEEKERSAGETNRIVELLVDGWKTHHASGDCEEDGTHWPQALEGRCDIFAKLLGERLGHMGVPHRLGVITRETVQKSNEVEDTSSSWEVADRNFFSHAVVVLDLELGRKTSVDALGTGRSGATHWRVDGRRRPPFRIRPHRIRECKIPRGLTSTKQLKDMVFQGALLHESKAARGGPHPRRSHAMAATGTVVGRPSCVKRLSRATRTGNSTT
jgi:hypothetical protein